MVDQRTVANTYRCSDRRWFRMYRMAHFVVDMDLKLLPLREPTADLPRSCTAHRDLAPWHGRVVCQLREHGNDTLHRYQFPEESGCRLMVEWL